MIPICTKMCKNLLSNTEGKEPEEAAEGWPYFTPLDLIYNVQVHTHRSVPSPGPGAPLPPAGQVDAVDKRQERRVQFELC